jgi:chloramphenicol-sensitive protein RarD
MTTPQAGRARGYAYALGAYTTWGLIPAYFKAVAPTTALELLAHRVLWAFLLLLAVGVRQDRLAHLRRAVLDRATLARLSLSTLLIAVNWLIYIWAVFGGRIVEASLGYFLTPLVNVLLGVVVLEERLERPVAIATAIAAAGVVWLGLLSGRPPWIAISLALSFGSYALVRKLAHGVGAVVGLTVETALLTPLALGYLLVAQAHGTLAFGHGPTTRDVLLLLAGPITAIPLLLFAGAVRRLPLTSLGVLQYISPSVQFLLAVLAYGEPFTAPQAAAFSLIWLALVLFAAHSLRRRIPEPVMER